MRNDPYALIELSESTTDQVAKRTALQDAIHLLSATETTSAEQAYALGYAWYLMPEETIDRGVETLRHLTAALRFESKHLYARLYLAHHYFDARQFALALPILLQFDANEFAASDQAWRDVKVAELILCCLLELRDEKRLASGLQEFLDRSNQVDADDLPIPTELIRVLQEVMKKSG